MNDTTIDIKMGKPSMRRTILTLLGAIGAFGVLTASYATAELPRTAPVGVIVSTAAAAQ